MNTKTRFKIGKIGIFVGGFIIVLSLLTNNNRALIYSGFVLLISIGIYFNEKKRINKK